MKQPSLIAYTHTSILSPPHTTTSVSMGNAIGVGGVKKKAKIMKIDGETFKLNAPAPAMDVLRDYPPRYVLLESEQVKKHGIRAHQLRPEEGLKPGKIYFLVEMPEFPQPDPRPETRRASLPHTGSGAKERLEGLMLLRRRGEISVGSGSESGPVRVKMRLPRAEIEKLMRESRDEAEVGERILEFCLKNSSDGQARSRKV